MIDLVSPIGFGQRGMIVSPPKAGKTTILKEIAAGIAQNYPKAHLMAALIGERPEEVTDIAQSVKGDVVASHFDEPPDAQTRVAEITLERAKRLVEMGVDVIILLDSITRLARAYNLSVAPSGRTLSGGFDPAALWPAKKFFGAARNCQEGGSLTIIGTALVDTGSRMDDLIYEEFKGTGNLELHLDRRLADRRIFPAIDIARSGTRQEELLLSEKDLKKVSTMRRMIDMLGPEERTSIFIERLTKTTTNEEFLESLGKG
jgi:transcription termination factor Rho